MDDFHFSHGSPELQEERTLAFYELRIMSCPDVPATIKALRGRSSLGIADLKQRIASQDVALSIDSTDGPVDMFGTDRIAHQHEAFLAALNDLRRIGNKVRVECRASDDSEAEVVDDRMLANLMRSQLEYYDQEHD